MRRALLALFLVFGGSVAAQRVELQQVVTGLNRPVAITHAGDNRLFIVLQGGQIVVFDGTALVPAPFLDIAALIGDSSNEKGLLGLAFHPRYSQNGFFFVNYTDTQGDTVVARYSVSSTNANRADPSSVRTILRIDQPFPNHNGGQLAFGPDGYLYIGMGDGGSGGDPGNRAQNMNELLGKMLRIDVDAGTPYAIPPSNPFVNRSGIRGEIWASGLRNPWRYSFDRMTGDLYIADVGQGDREEINFAPATSIGGENYGWRRMEGNRCYNPSTGCNPDGSLILPIIEYDHNLGCSVTGGYVYRGARHPRLQGLYIYGDYCTGVIWGASRNAASGSWSSRVLIDTTLQISTFGEDAAGEVYVARHHTTGGTIYRIVDALPVPPKRRSARH
ncbi:MAG TPA: PQQ-dependent sugar dehydrogenase [Thermoanaerobaculia bacterium]|jgi:glucose/arabinose dehydrogenase